jgi:hypothetical protein
MAHVCDVFVSETTCRIDYDLSTFDRELYDYDRPAERYGSIVLPAMTCVAMHDPARRRGLWFRADDTASGVVVSLFAGQEAGDSYVTLHEGDPLLPVMMRQLLDVLSDARFAFGEGHASIGDWSAVESRFAPNEGGYCAETAERCELFDDPKELLR